MGRQKGSKNKPKRDEYSEEVKRAEQKAEDKKIEEKQANELEQARDFVETKKENPIVENENL